MDLTQVKGVGPSAKKKLAKAGIESIEDLAEIDLRKTDVEGLSSENVAQLRENAERFLEARNSQANLTLVEGLGPSAEAKLKDAGISSIDDLAYIDLRKTDVEGLSTEHIQKLKRNARYLLSDEA